MYASRRSVGCEIRQVDRVIEVPQGRYQASRMRSRAHFPVAATNRAFLGRMSRPTGTLVVRRPLKAVS